MCGSRATTRSRTGHWPAADGNAARSWNGAELGPAPEKTGVRITQRREPRHRQSELGAINSALPARLFDADFHKTNFAAWKLTAHLPADLLGDMLRKQFCARVRQRQQNHVFFRENQFLRPVTHFELMRAGAHCKCRARGLNQRAVV